MRLGEDPMGVACAAQRSRYSTASRPMSASSRSKRACRKACVCVCVCVVRACARAWLRKRACVRGYAVSERARRIARAGACQICSAESSVSATMALLIAQLAINYNIDSII